eukprot:7858748-Pyramimonas_sp.AAC.1
MVHEGWWSQKYRHPTGEHAELWAKIGLLFHNTGRRPEHVTVLFTNSHMEAEDVVHRAGSSWMTVGNAAADTLAGEGAIIARIPEAVRTDILEKERVLYLIRMRILRSHPDAMEAEKTLQENPPNGRHQRPGARGRREAVVIGESTAAAAADPPPPSPASVSEYSIGS